MHGPKTWYASPCLWWVLRRENHEKNFILQSRTSQYTNPARPESRTYQTQLLKKQKRLTKPGPAHNPSPQTLRAHTFKSTLFFLIFYFIIIIQSWTHLYLIPSVQKLQSEKERIDIWHIFGFPRFLRGLSLTTLTRCELTDPNYGKLSLRNP